MPKKGKEPAGLRRWRLAHRKGKKSHRSSRSSAGESHAPGIGASYQTGKLAGQILIPVVDSVRQAGHGGADALKTQLANHFLAPANRNAYLEGQVVGIVDYMASKKIGHAASLSRGSISAWAPEAYAALKGWSSGGGVVDRVEAGLAATNGYLASDGSFDGSRAVPYAIIKYGAWGVKKVATHLGVIKPLNKALNMVGATA